MKKYVRSDFDMYNYFRDVCSKSAKEASDAIWQFQDDITGDPAISDSLSNEDIETLDKARIILDNFAKNI